MFSKFESLPTLKIFTEKGKGFNMRIKLSNLNNIKDGRSIYYIFLIIYSLNLFLVVLYRKPFMYSSFYYEKEI